MAEERSPNAELTSRGKEILVLAAQAGLVGAAIVVLGMIAAYFENLEEFRFSPLQLLPYLVGLWVAATIGLVAITSLLANWLPSARYWFLPFVAVAAWAQAAFNVPDYGPLDGGAVDWRRAQSLWDVILLSAVGAGFYVMRDRLSTHRHALIVVGGVFAVQFAYALTVVSMNEIPEAVEPDPEIHRLSKGKNVFLIILDAFQGDILKEILQRAPEYEKELDGFVYWTDSVAFHPTTYPTVPALFLGEPFRNQMPFSDFRRRLFTEDSVLWHLSDAGYQIDLLFKTVIRGTRAAVELTDNIVNVGDVGLSWRSALEEALHLFEFSAFRNSPQFLRRLLYQEGVWLLSRQAFMGYPDHHHHRIDMMLLEELQANAYVDGERPLFRFIHIFTPHRPIVLNAEMQPERRSFSRETYVDQSEAAIRMLLGFLETLKEKGVYDNSRIVVVADHGSGGGIGVRHNLSEALANETALSPTSRESRLKARATPLFLTKDVHQQGSLVIRHDPVHLGDVARSLVDRIAPENRFPGYSVFSEDVPHDRLRSFYHYEWPDNGWGADYLEPMTEYEIEGHAWLPSSWSGPLREHGREGVSEIPDNARPEE